MSISSPVEWDATLVVGECGPGQRAERHVRTQRED
jgi:hypothetical protein